MIVIRFVGLALVIVAAGCDAAPKSEAAVAASVSVINQIRYGMSIEELRSAFDERVRATSARSPAAGFPLQHRWTTSHDGREAMLVSGEASPDNVRYFLFIDRNLSAILPPHFSTIRPVDESLKSAIDASAVPIEVFHEQCHEQLAEYERVSKHYEFNIALAPMLLFENPARDRERYVKYMHEFDAMQVQLGATMQSMNAVFGNPIRVSSVSGEKIVTYGREIELYSYPAPLVSAGLLNDVVVWVRTE